MTKPLMQKWQRDHFVSELNETYNPLIQAAELKIKALEAEAIEVAEKVLSLDKKYPGIMGFNRISQVQYWRGEAYSACEKWG